MTTTDDFQAPASWGTVKLGELAVHEKGKKPRKQSPIPSALHPIPYIDICAFEEGVIRSWTNGLDCRICRESELLMVWDGARSGLVGNGKNGALGSTLVRLDFPLIENQYAFYFFQLKYQEINSRTKGSGTPHVDPFLLWNYEFPVPPLPEQHRIVTKIEELFSELDKGIESLAAARAKLDVYRQSVLKHAFEGKLTAQWREENKEKLETPEQLLTRIKREREARYEQQLQVWKDAVKKWEEGGKSGKMLARPKKLTKVTDLLRDVTEKLPPLPESWEWEKLGWMTCGVEYGTAAKSATTGRIPVLRMGNIQNAKFDWTDLVYTSVDDEIADYLLHDGDVLFNRTNSPDLVGKTAIYKGERPAVFAGYLIRVNHIPTIVDGQYLNLFLNSHIARQYGNNVKTDGVNQSNINGTKLSNFPFPYCSLEEQRKIADNLEKTVSLLDETETDIDRELRNADALRQSILKKAFSGQLVPQDPDDEPASSLLERIKAEKAARSQNNTRAKRRGMTATA